MTFFDQKTDVLDVELTQYGKYLLSRGKFKPALYAFYDDDIIYDATYAGVSETSGEAVARIKEMPRTRSQYTFSGREAASRQNDAIQKSEKHYVFGRPLGTSVLGDRNFPAATISIMSGEIESTKIQQTGSMPSMHTPLLTLNNTEYVISADKPEDNPELANSFTNPVTFDDGTSLYIENDFIMMQIKEENVEDAVKNFEIELFLVEEDLEGVENYTALYFDKDFEQIRNGILVDEEKLSTEDRAFFEKQRINDPHRVKNHFNLTVDSEIDKELICSLQGNVINDSTSRYDIGMDCEESVPRLPTNIKTRTENLYDSSFNEKDIKKC